jgi:hypothetical protein
MSDEMDPEEAAFYQELEGIQNKLTPAEWRLIETVWRGAQQNHTKWLILAAFVMGMCAGTSLMVIFR